MIDVNKGENNESSEAKKMKLDETGSKPKMFFRSYVPIDKELKKVVMKPSKPLDVKEQVKEQLEAAKEKITIEEVDLVNIVPQKPDSDLKRDIQKKLDKLERRTNKALAELIRDKIQSKTMTVDEVAASLALNPDET